METTTERRRTRLRAEDRRDQIIEAATALLGRRGFWGTSLQDVADECDFTVTGILYHFHTKEDLLEAVLDTVDSDFTDSVIRELARAGPVEERGDEPPPPTSDPTDTGVWRLCRILIRLDAENPGRARLYTVLESESITPDHPAHDYFLKREQRLLGHFRSTVPHGVEDPEALARRAMAVVSGFRLQWLKTGQDIEPADMWEQMNTALREMLGAPAALPPAQPTGVGVSSPSTGSGVRGAGSGTGRIPSHQ